MKSEEVRCAVGTIVITPTPDGIFLRQIDDAKEQSSAEMLKAIKEREKEIPN